MSRRGPMTGGYIDVKKSKLDLARTIKQLEVQKRDLEVCFLLNFF